MPSHCKNKTLNPFLPSGQMGCEKESFVLYMDVVLQPQRLSASACAALIFIFDGGQGCCSGASGHKN
jgi:hypothetical protein